MTFHTSGIAIRAQYDVQSSQRRSRTRLARWAHDVMPS